MGVAAVGGGGVFFCCLLHTRGKKLIFMSECRSPAAVVHFFCYEYFTRNISKYANFLLVEGKNKKCVEIKINSKEFLSVKKSFDMSDKREKR